MDIVYPNNFDYSEDPSFPLSQPLYSFDDPWSNLGDFEMPSVNDTLPSHEGLDAFGFAASHDDSLSELSDTLTSDDEVGQTPPQSPQHEHDFVVPKQEPFSLEQLQQQNMLLQLQQLQYQAYLQQRLLQTQFQLSSHLALPNSFVVTKQLPAPVPPMAAIVKPCPSPVIKSTLPGYSYFNCQAYDEPLGNMKQYGFDPTESSSPLTSLDTSHFGVPQTGTNKTLSIPIDISGNLTDAQYNKIFKKYHLYLQLDSHPTLSEQDLEEIKVHGKMYFLKNVKTIVPKIGPWKFNAHISHRRSDERQYNIPGIAITCKVKEWLNDDGLWRLYHYKKGKTVASKKTK